MELSLVSVFGAGVLTLATPCVLPMLPVYLAMLAGAGLNNTKRTSRWKLLASTALFVSGFVAVFTLLGLGASAVGGFLQSHRSTMLLVGGVLIVLFGLRFVGVLRFSWLERTLQVPSSGSASSALGAIVFGMVFALGWTPCVGPILGSVLTYTAATTASPVKGALLLFTYGLGVGLPMIALSLAADRLLPKLKRVLPYLPRIEKATGLAMVAVGLLLIVPQVARWMRHSQPDAASAAARSEERMITPLIGAPSPVPRLVEFRTRSCPVCERMAPRIEQLKKECAHHDIEILEIDVSDDRYQELARQYQITGVPSIGLLRSDGTLAGKLVGEQPLSALRSAADELGAGCASGDPDPTRAPSEPGAACASGVTGSGGAPASCGM